MVFIVAFDFPFKLIVNTIVQKFEMQTFSVYSLKKPTAQRTVYRHRCTDDLIDDIFVLFEVGFKHKK